MCIECVCNNCKSGINKVNRIWWAFDSSFCRIHLIGALHEVIFVVDVQICSSVKQILIRLFDFFKGNNYLLLTEYVIICVCLQNC